MTISPYYGHITVVWSYDRNQVFITQNRIFMAIWRLITAVIRFITQALPLEVDMHSYIFKYIHKHTRLGI